VVVYFTNNSLPGTVVTSVTDLSIRNIDDIGNTKCGIGCSKTGMRFNPTKPFGCECINPDYKYNPVTDICDCVTNCGSVPPPLACGNGYIDGCEQCDFGTAENNGVVCYPNCTLVEDSGYACRYETDATDPKLVKSICPPICGDFIIRGNEECDEFGPQCS
jgi:hypothetical protein